MIRLYYANNGQLYGGRLTGVDSDLSAEAIARCVKRGELIPSGVMYAFRWPWGRRRRFLGRKVRIAVAALRRRKAARILLERQLPPPLPPADIDWLLGLHLIP